jgi:hypothetical protein
MAAVKAAYEAALGDLRAAGATLKAIGHDGWQRVEAVVKELEGDAPVLEHEAAADAAQVVTTAETEGIVPAEHQAVADAAKLGAEAAHDVETAVADGAKGQ